LATVTALNAIVFLFLKPASEATEYARQLGFEMSSPTIRSEGLAGVFGNGHTTGPANQAPPENLTESEP